MVEQISNEVISEYKEAFSLFDSDGSGKIATKDLIIVMRSLGTHPYPPEYTAVLEKANKEGDGTVSFIEFLSIMQSNMKHNEKIDELVEKFRIFDRNGNGRVPISDFKYVWSTLEPKILTDEEVEQSILEMSLDGDGLIPYEEFIIGILQY